MKRIKNIFLMLSYNLDILVRFIIIYNFLYLLFSRIVFNFVLRFIINVSGFKYITKSNYKEFFVHPMTITFAVVVMLFLSIFFFIEIVAIMYILDQSFQRSRTSLRRVIVYCLKNLLRVLAPFNIIALFVILFTILYPGFGVATDFFGSFNLPGILAKYLDAIINLRLFLVVLWVLMIVLFFRWMYSINYYLTEKKNFIKSMHMSAKLRKGNRIKDILFILISIVLITVVFVAFIALFVLIIVVIQNFIKDYYMAKSIISSILVALSILVSIIYMSLSFPIICAIITSLYYDKVTNEDNEYHHLPADNMVMSKKLKKFRILILGFAGVIAIAGLTFYVNGMQKGEYSLKISHVRNIEISAHRGGMATRPENTMVAFKNAYKQGADWIEIDVQQSKDGVLYIMHDYNFKRTTGVNKKAWELTWKEIQELDAGYYFSDKYEGEKIPSLEEVIIYAKKKGIGLNIELKANKHNVNYEESVVELINKYDFVDQCVVTSQKYSLVKNVKKLDPNIDTVYVMSIALGNIEKFKYADAFSINQFFATKDIVDRMHSYGKEVYVWTVDDTEDIDKMIGLGVDNIVTNDVDLVKSRINKSKTSNIIVDIYYKLAEFFYRVN